MLPTDPSPGQDTGPSASLLFGTSRPKVSFQDQEERAAVNVRAMLSSSDSGMIVCTSTQVSNVRVRAHTHVCTIKIQIHGFYP